MSAALHVDLIFIVTTCKRNDFIWFLVWQISPGNTWRSYEALHSIFDLSKAHPRASSANVTSRLIPSKKSVLLALSRLCLAISVNFHFLYMAFCIYLMNSMYVCMYLLIGKGQSAQKRPYWGEDRIKRKIYE